MNEPVETCTRALASVTPVTAAMRAAWRWPSPPSPPPSWRESLAVVAAVGDRFELAPSWPATLDEGIPAVDLTDAQMDHAIALRGTGLGTTDPKVAAVMWLQWYSYRIAAPLLGSWVLHRRIPDVSAANLAFRFDGEGRPAFVAQVTPRLFAVAGHALPDAETVVTPDLLATIVRVLLHEHLLPLAARVQTRYRLGGPIIRGTVASQIGMALTFIDAHTTVAWQQVADDAIRLLDLTTPLVAGQGRSGDVIRIASGARVGMTFRRGTCCTVYRSPKGTMCGGCPLRSDDERAAVWAERLAGRPAWSFAEGPEGEE